MTAAALALLTTTAQAGQWENSELAGRMCVMRTGFTNESGTIAVTFEKGHRLLWQLFKNDWYFGGTPVTVKIHFDDKRGQLAQGYAHQIGRQAIADFPVATKGADWFINSFGDYSQFTVEFADGSPAWTTNTPGEGEVLNRFSKCIENLGGIHYTPQDYR